MRGGVRTVVLNGAELSRLMPMHMLVDSDGTIVGAGPTLQRLRTPQEVTGANIFELFRLRRPHGVATMTELAARGGHRLNLEFRAPPNTPLKGHFVTEWQGLFVFDLGFGIMVNEAVSTYGLTATDFAPTSLAVEVLYLAEANAAAMAESRNLNRRLTKAKAEAERLARTDALTGLRNRRGMEMAIADMVEREVAFSLMHVDLDYFKSINDTLGHAAGDHVLSHVARILESETRRGDLVIRLGGDEFVVICHDLLDRRRLAAIANRIIAAIDEPIGFEGSECRVSASVGVTTSDLYVRPDAAQMLRDADLALYRSKELGRARVTFFSGEEPTAGWRPSEAGPARTRSGAG